MQVKQMPSLLKEMVHTLSSNRRKKLFPHMIGTQASFGVGNPKELVGMLVHTQGNKGY